MYVPHFNAMTDDPEIRQMVADIGSAQLITVGADGYPLATLLPVIWRGDTVIAHMARANQHWKAIGTDRPVLLVVTGPQAYISPTWYASKAEHGKVVPTWNYVMVQARGLARVIHDGEWLYSHVTQLTRFNEQSQDKPWQVTDAPPDYIASQIREAVLKWQQNDEPKDDQTLVLAMRKG